MAASSPPPDVALRPAVPRGEAPCEIVTRDGVALDARFAVPSNATRAVVLAHPHPLYGGSMDDAVIVALARVLGEHGVATLRFDFRGVGRSDGRYGGGASEIEDVVAAVRFAARAVETVAVAGYSFGSFVALQAARVHAAPIERLAIVAPAASILPYDALPANGARYERPVAVVLGDLDSFCDVPRARVLAARLGASIAVLSGVDHFFSRSRRRVAELLLPFLQGARDRIDEGALA